MSMYELEENGIQQIQSSSDVRKGKAVSYTVTAGDKTDAELLIEIIGLDEQENATAYSNSTELIALPLNGLDPVPFGLIAFGSTNLLLSLTGIAARGVTIPNIIVAQTFLGGVGQVIAGIFCGILGQTSNFATFTTFGMFWIGYTYSLSTISGLKQAYEGTNQLRNAMGLYLTVWLIISLVYTFACHRSNAFLIGLLTFLSFSYLFAALSSFSEVGTTTAANFAVAGGASGIVSASCAFYLAIAGLLKADTPLRMPVFDMGMRRGRD